MSIRRAVFWAHLVAGVVTGVFVLVMATTGVLLTYERQILAAIDQQYDVAPGEIAAVMSADDLADAAALLPKPPTALVFENREGAAIGAQVSRGQTVFLDPRTGEALGDNGSAAKSFFRAVEDLHRWLALEGAGRDVGRAINGASNLAFLFLVVSGLYLWLPKIWRWRIVEQRLFLRRGLPNAQARDYNWHHVFGVWALIPLFFIVATAVVFSYPWANGLVYQAFGEQAPQGRGPGGGGGARVEVGAPASDVAPLDAPLQAILEDAKRYDADWRSISLSLPQPSAEAVSVRVDTGTGGQPQAQTTLVYRRADAERVAVQGFDSRSPGRQARAVIRFLHTGEVLGVVGQTIAGLASLATMILVWTGFAQAWRRLIAPSLRARRA